MDVQTYDFLWNESTPQDQVIAGYQDLIDSGMAWKLEGHVGRTAMDLINAGLCTLGDEGHRDFYGNYVPSKHDLIPGAPGTQEFVNGHEA